MKAVFEIDGIELMVKSENEPASAVILTGRQQFCEPAGPYDLSPAGTLNDPKDPKLIFYGPHTCARCGNKTILKVSREQGGDEFEYPEHETIYPNRPWPRHMCEPSKSLPLPERRASRHVFGMRMKPSHARAFASAVLSAATEARE